MKGILIVQHLQVCANMPPAVVIGSEMVKIALNDDNINLLHYCGAAGYLIGDGSYLIRRCRSNAAVAAITMYILVTSDVWNDLFDGGHFAAIDNLIKCGFTNYDIEQCMQRLSTITPIATV